MTIPEIFNCIECPYVDLSNNGKPIGCEYSSTGKSISAGKTMCPIFEQLKDNADFRKWDPKNKIEVFDEKKWDLVFKDYWSEFWNRTIKYVSEESKPESYKFKFLEYDHGVFNDCHIEKINALIISFLTHLDCTRSKANINKAKMVISSYFFTSIHDYDADKNIRNCANGLLNLEEKTLRMHTPDYLTRSKQGVNFIENLTDEYQTPIIDGFRFVDPVAFARIEIYIRAVLFGRMDDEVTLFVFGGHSTGKSTVHGLLKLLFKDVYVSYSVDQFGGQFGMAPVWGSRIWMNPEIRYCTLDTESVRLYKAITGRDGSIMINPKGDPAFMVEFEDLFGAEFGNIAYKLPGSDRSGFMRRPYIVELNHRFPKNRQVKSEILKEIDIWFSELIHSGYTPIIHEGMDMDEYERKNRKKWDKWSEPAKRIIGDIFTSGEGLYRPDALFVYELVERILDESQMSVPPERELKKEITQAIHSIGGRKENSNGKGYYNGVAFLYEDHAEKWYQWLLDNGQDQMAKYVRGYIDTGVVLGVRADIDRIMNPRVKIPQTRRMMSLKEERRWNDKQEKGPIDGYTKDY